ncbi:hypothetical protein CDAR_369751 [Caerostris darwini]|uniref:Uncharacterized protein n=1 Tax=Caerostris darwini TaxID=1538125 RepID=A0AAV4QXN3_9ARAC|nr:hypothetical protein CDAR_369751 [Caerostris darwini]
MAPLEFGSSSRAMANSRSSVSSQRPYLPFSFPTELFFKLICSGKCGAALLKLRNLSTYKARVHSLFEIPSSAPRESRTMEQNVALPGLTALSAMKPASIHASIVSMEQFAKLREVFLPLQLLPK